MGAQVSLIGQELLTELKDGETKGDSSLAYHLCPVLGEANVCVSEVEIRGESATDETAHLLLGASSSLPLWRSDYQRGPVLQCFAAGSEGSVTVLSGE